MLSLLKTLRLATAILASLHLATAAHDHHEPVLLVGVDTLNHTIRNEVSAIVQQATANITTVVTQQATASINAIVEEVKQDMNLALERAIKEVTDTVEQLLKPLLNETFSQPLPGKTPTNPATSCRNVKQQRLTAPSGYYWIQNPDIPLVQLYCDMDKLEPYLGTVQAHPGSSCREIRERSPIPPSGYYWVKPGNGPPVQVYCDMTRTCGGITGGWMEVANIDMTDSSHTCPQGLRTLTTPLRMCGRSITSPGCSSATFDSHGISYTRVCGKIIGYQNGSTDAFLQFIQNQALTIDGPYLDGVSLTHGSQPRKHIWSFAAGVDETQTINQRSKCPCITGESTPIPPWVGNDYFCDSGAKELWQNTFYPDHPLWDGEGCGPTSTCCSFNNPPWFSKQLPSPTTDDIEMRLCVDGYSTNEDVPVEKVELFVQ